MLDLITKEAAAYVDMLERLLLTPEDMQDETVEMIVECLNNESWRKTVVHFTDKTGAAFIDAVLVIFAERVKPKLAAVECDHDWDYDLEADPSGEAMSCTLCGDPRREAVGT